MAWESRKRYWRPTCESFHKCRKIYIVRHDPNKQYELATTVLTAAQWLFILLCCSIAASLLVRRLRYQLAWLYYFRLVN